MKRIGYSYGRFSSDEQSDGDSTRRQNALRDGWLKRHPEVVLDTVYMDCGTSALRGKHRRVGSPLRNFLDEIEADRVP